MKTTDNLQYVFACLATHSYIISRMRNNFDEVHKHFKLSSQDVAGLKLFMDTQGERLLTSAILMEEKRWREMLPAIKYVAAVVSKDELKSYWLEYLTSIKAVENIPVSTLSEAINFLYYILTKYTTGSLLHEIIQYEIAKNTVSAFDSIDTEKTIYPVEQLTDDDASYRVVFNPSYLIVDFNLPISKIINDLTKGRVVDSYNNKIENILFVKSRVSNIVRTISLHPVASQLLRELINCKNLKSWKQRVASGEDTYQKFLINMMDIDLVTIEQIGGEHYVYQD